MKYVYGTLYTLLTILLVAIAGVFLASMIPVPGHIAIKIVKSGSMEPTIHVGSIVIVKPFDTYAVGDVITFGADTKTQIPTTHRIIAIESENGTALLTTKGDANEEPDSNRTKQSDVLGKVIVSIPSVGYVLAFAKTPIGFAMLIGLPAAIIIFDEIIKIVSEIRTMLTPKKRNDAVAPGEVHVRDLQQHEPRTEPRSKSIDGIRTHSRML